VTYHSADSLDLSTRQRNAMQAARMLADRAEQGLPIEWSPALSVGLESIDGQHRVLVAYINQLSSAILRGQPGSVLGQVLSGLDGYTRIHFRHEERLFKMHGWDEGTEHADTHRAFERQLQDFQQRFAAGDTSLAMAVMKFMIQWLGEHILLDDMAYSPFLKEHGVR
jgi:hemerythrin-like metal-binding protein